MKTITKDDLQPQDNPGNGWYLIEAHGEHPITTKSGVVIQVIDNEAVKAIVEAGITDPAGLLIDKDHLSHDGEMTTEAMGWSRDLAALIDEQGNYHLCALNEWSDIGQPAIAGKRYKHHSTEYKDLISLGGNRYRPLRLSGLALTNRPNNSGQPAISNREPSPEPTQTPKNQMEELKEIAIKLGLPETATQEEILAAIDRLHTESTKAKEAEVDTLLNAEGADKLPEDEKEMYKEQLLCNRDRTLPILQNRIKEFASQEKSPATPKYQGASLHNRASLTGKQSPVKEAIDVRDKAFEIQKNTGCSYFDAINMARRSMQS